MKLPIALYIMYVVRLKRRHLYNMSLWISGCGEPLFFISFIVVPAVGPIPGLIATLQVFEALKLIIKFGYPLAGKLLSFDGETMAFNYFGIKKRPGRKVCSA